MMGIVAARVKRPSATSGVQKTSARTTSQKLGVLPRCSGSGNDFARSAMWVILPQPCAQKSSPATPTRSTSSPIELVMDPPFDDITILPLGEPASLRPADSMGRWLRRGRGLPSARIR